MIFRLLQITAICLMSVFAAAADAGDASLDEPYIAEGKIIKATALQRLSVVSGSLLADLPQSEDNAITLAQTRCPSDYRNCGAGVCCHAIKSTCCRSTNYIWCGFGKSCR